MFVQCITHYFVFHRPVISVYVYLQQTVFKTKKTILKTCAKRHIINLRLGAFHTLSQKTNLNFQQTNL